MRFWDSRRGICYSSPTNRCRRSPGPSSTRCAGELAALAAAVADLVPAAPAGRLEELGLADDELAEVIAFAHFVLARRRRVNGS